MNNFEFRADTGQGIAALNALTAAFKTYNEKVDVSTISAVKLNTNLKNNTGTITAVNDIGKKYTATLKDFAMSTNAANQAVINYNGVLKASITQSSDFVTSQKKVAQAAFDANAILQRASTKAKDFIRDHREVIQKGFNEKEAAVYKAKVKTLQEELAKRIAADMADNKSMPDLTKLMSRVQKVGAAGYSGKFVDYAKLAERLVNLNLDKQKFDRVQEADIFAQNAYKTASRLTGGVGPGKQGPVSGLETQAFVKSTDIMIQKLRELAAASKIPMDLAQFTAAFKSLQGGHALTTSSPFYAMQKEIAAVVRAQQNLGKESENTRNKLVAAAVAGKNLTKAEGDFVTAGLSGPALASSNNLRKINDALKIEHAKSIADIKNANREAFLEFKRSWDQPLKFAALQTARKMIYTIITDVRQGLQAIQDLEIKISEIRTISQNKQLSFGQWRDEIRRISDETGRTLEDVTQGVYETVSNQVGEGQKAISFIGDVAKFQRAAVTDVTTSVDLLSGAINAYKADTRDATEISASLFKTIEVGRVTAKEMGGEYGNIAVQAAQLGISMDELNAALSLLTIQGIKYSYAATQMRNIMLKMIKPTEDMKKLYREWGFESAEQAIKANGLVGVLKKLNDEMQKANLEEGGSTRIAALGGNVRAISGILGLIGNNMEAYNQTLDKFATKNAYFIKASNIAVESHGKVVQVELNKIRNFFVDSIGSGIMRYTAALIETTGGASNIMSKFGGILESIPAAAVAAGLIALTSKVHGLATAFKSTNVENITFLRNYVVAHNETIQKMMLEEATLRRMGNIQAANNKQALIEKEIRMATLGTIAKSALIMGSITAVTYGVFNLMDAMEKTDRAYEKLFSGIDTDATSSAEKIVAELERIENKSYQTKQAIDKAFSAPLQVIAESIAAYNKVVDESDKAIDDAVSAMRKSMDSYVSSRERILGQIAEAINKVNSQIAASFKEQGKITNWQAHADIYEDMISNVGKIDDGWKKARIQLTNYYRDLERGRATNRYDDPSRRMPKDQSDFAKSFQLMQAYRSRIIKDAEVAYTNKDADQGRQLMEKAQALTGTWKKYGLSNLEILKESIRLAEKRVELERAFVDAKAEERKQAEKLQEEQTAAFLKLKAISDQITAVRTKSEKPEESAAKLAELTQAFKEAALAMSAGDDRIEQLFNSVNADSTAGAIKEGFKFMTDANKRLMDDSIRKATDANGYLNIISENSNRILDAMAKIEELRGARDAITTQQDKTKGELSDTTKKRTDSITKSNEAATVLLDILSKADPATRMANEAKLRNDAQNIVESEQSYAERQRINALADKLQETQPKAMESLKKALEGKLLSKEELSNLIGVLNTRPRGDVNEVDEYFSKIAEPIRKLIEAQREASGYDSKINDINNEIKNSSKNFEKYNQSLRDALKGNESQTPREVMAELQAAITQYNLQPNVQKMSGPNVGSAYRLVGEGKLSAETFERYLKTLSEDELKRQRSFLVGTNAISDVRGNAAISKIDEELAVRADMAKIETKSVTVTSQSEDRNIQPGMKQVDFNKEIVKFEVAPASVEKLVNEIAKTDPSVKRNTARGFGADTAAMRKLLGGDPIDFGVKKAREALGGEIKANKDWINGEISKNIEANPKAKRIELKPSNPNWIWGQDEKNRKARPLPDKKQYDPKDKSWIYDDPYLNRNRDIPRAYNPRGETKWRKIDPKVEPKKEAPAPVKTDLTINVELDGSVLAKKLIKNINNAKANGTIKE